MLVIASLLSAACGHDVRWTDAPPPDLRGLWVEAADDDPGLVDFRDSIRVSADRLVVVRHEADGTPHRRDCAPIRRVSRTDDTLVIFCGRPSDDHIAETRIEFDANERFSEASVGEIFSPWGGEEPVRRSIGRFRKGR